MIKLYGFPRSSASRCFWMLEELGLPYETVHLDMKNKEHKSDWYTKINPNGKIPALTDGEFSIWESMAITNYLAKKYNSPLAPQTPEEDGHILQWSFWSLVDLQEPAVGWLIQELFVPAEKKNLHLIEEAKTKIARCLTVLENGLQDKKFLVGSRFTVADLNVASVVTILMELKYDFSHFKNIQQWMNGCTDRPSFQK
ncbi:MAG: glutathione S-transferase family protein, partial [Pseudobdellovibrionaceae bacterium]